MRGNKILSLSIVEYSPDDLRLIAIDGVSGDLIIPNEIPHLLTPLIVDFEKATTVLKWIINEV